MAVKIDGFIEETQPEEVMKLLQSLASNWGDVFNTNKLKFVRLCGGNTNVVYQVTWPRNTAENDDRTVLVRIYGEAMDIFFDREEEIRTFEFISTHGHGPRLLGRFPQGRVEEFIHAKTLSSSDLREPEISTLIAAKMRDFHNLNIPGSKNAVLWPRMREWLIKARRLCSLEHAKEFQLDILENEINSLEKELSQHHQDVVFCHNDLVCGNIMIDDTRTITLIDYEYASYNPVASDLANHFCEWAANYQTDTPHVLDYNIYPDLKERRRFVQSYLSSSGNQPNEAEVDQLIDDVEKYTLAIHLLWGLWGILASYMTCIEFNCIEYARQRFRQYWLRKPQLLKGKMLISQINDLVLEKSKKEIVNGGTAHVT